MNRIELLTALKAASPALASKPILPAFGNFCVRRGRILAYDDVVAIEVPFAGFADLEAGLPGAELLSWLGLCRAAEVQQVSSSDTEMVLRAGRSRLTLATLPVSEYSFKMPSPKKAVVSLPVTPALVAALSAVALSSGTDPAHPWRLGCTIQVGKDCTTFYSSDNFSVTRSQVRGGGAAYQAVISPRFLALFLDFVRGEKKAELFLAKGWSMVRLANGAALWSKTVGAAKTKEFAKTLAALESEAPKPVAIPPGLAAALARAEALLAFAADRHAAFTFAGGKLRISGSAPSGIINDSLKGVAGVPDCSDRYLPSLLRRVLPLSPKFSAIPGQALVFVGEGFVHAVSALVAEADDSTAAE